MSGRQADPSHPLYKTTLCQFYPRDCRLGAQCPFAHGAHELRSPNPRSIRTKKPCRHGKDCYNRDSGCEFGHGTDEEDNFEAFTTDVSRSPPPRHSLPTLSVVKTAKKSAVPVTLSPPRRFVPTLSVSPKSPTSFAPSSPPSVNAGSSFPALSPTRQASRSIPASTDLADLITRIAGMGFPEASASHAAYKVSAAKKQAGVPGFVTENEVIEFLINETAAEAKKPKSEPTEGARECSVCFDHQIGAVLIPCGHASYCFQCAEGLRKKGKGCAICRKKIEGVTKLYF